MSDPQTITVTLPAIEDYADDIARADRMMQAAELAGRLQPEEFREWCKYGKLLMNCMARSMEQTPGTTADQSNVQGI